MQLLEDGVVLVGRARDGAPPLVGRAVVAAALAGPSWRGFWAGAGIPRLVRDVAVVAGRDGVHVSCRGHDGGWRLAAVIGVPCGRGWRERS